ncbi:MAG: membrane-bound lytic murein transglycosylase MltF [Magnetococcales bacterium]|nr:membrane-bound lytic murein transglycosylase MltF [Magnetococcales bacterium]
MMTIRNHGINRIMGFILAALAMVPLLSLLTSCQSKTESSELERIRTTGHLTVLTRTHPALHHDRLDHTAGFEREMIVSFAHYLRVTPTIVPLQGEGEQELFERLRRGEADIGAMGVTQRLTLEQDFLYGPIYQNVDQQVVCRRGGRQPANLLQLGSTSLVVMRDSPHEVRLRQLQQLVPELSWVSVDHLSTTQLLEKVWLGELECTIADSDVVAIHHRYWPELTVHFSIGATLPVSWILPKRSTALQQEMLAWFDQVRVNGFLDDLQELYFGHIDPDRFDYVDHTQFFHRISERLPLYRSLFQTAEKRHQVPWTLLAAMSYQESHWDPNATSATGVRGLMMLTNPTAQDIGVKNRLDPEESILGGASYLADILRQLPEEIREPDRTWIAMAAYNVGFGHLQDARELAIQQGKNPNVWRELKTVLPLLSVEKYYKALSRGQARGMEPVRYVQMIRHYHDLLIRHEELRQAPKTRQNTVPIPLPGVKSPSSAAAFPVPGGARRHRSSQAIACHPASSRRPQRS